MAALMRMGWAGTMRRLVLGAFLLLALSFAAAPASAHGDRHGGPARSAQSAAGTWRIGPVADSTQASAITSPNGKPGSSDQGSDCPACCDMGQCFAPPVALPGDVSVTTWLPDRVAAYGRNDAHDMAGVRSVPGARPPRLGA